MPGIEPGPPRLSPRTVRPPYWWRITDQLRPIGNWGGQTDSHRYQRHHGAQCCCYTMTTIEMEPLVGLAPTNTSLRNSSCCWLRHRGGKELQLSDWRLQIGGRTRAGKFFNRQSAIRNSNWCSHVDLHHELPPSQSGVHIYLHLESVWIFDFRFAIFDLPA